MVYYSMNGDDERSGWCVMSLLSHLASLLELELEFRFNSFFVFGSNPAIIDG